LDGEPIWADRRPITGMWIVTWLTRAPAVPETVTSKEPAAEEVIVHAEVSPPWITEGEQTAVTPAGLEVASRVTAPWKPFCDWRLTLDIALPPAMKERLRGEADREKSGGDSTKTSAMFRALDLIVFTVAGF